MRSACFHSGICWFYWKAFDPQNYEYDDGEQLNKNKNDFGGHSKEILFVKNAKFKSLKEEILENKDNEVLNPQIFDEKISQKVKELMETDKAKAIRAEWDRWGSVPAEYFGIKREAPITLQHISALVCYSDFSALCTAFSSTFRPLSAYETLESVKRRNESYYFMAKLLIEAVNCFGVTGEEKKWNEGQGKWVRKERGPFFCGMSFVLNLSSFTIRLFGPTSTTKEKLVAIGFAKENGCILEFDNEHLPCDQLKMWNMEWISRYPEEQERFFVHGQHPLQLVGVYLTRTSKNYALYMQAMQLLDSMLSGVFPKGDDSKLDDVAKHLFGEKVSLPKYVRNNLDHFKFAKEFVVIDFDRFPEKFRKYAFVGAEYEVDYDYKYEAFALDDDRNFINKHLVDSLPNIKRIHLESVWHPFCLQRLLNLVLSVKADKIHKHDIKWSVRFYREWIDDVFASVKWENYKQIKAWMEDIDDFNKHIFIQ